MTDSTDQHIDTEEHLVTIDEVLAKHPNTSPVPVLPQLSVALGLLVLVFSVTYLGVSKATDSDTDPANAVRIDTMLPTQIQEASVTTSEVFEDMQLIAQSAIVWDVKAQRILFNKNADDVRPLASITKLMTALVSSEILDPEEHVAITVDALKTEGDSGFVDGETFTAQNLIDLTLITSSNDGAEALGAAVGNIIAPDAEADAVFVHAMNVRAKDLSLYNTHFLNTTGLDISETEAGAYGTARDVALLMEYLVTQKPDVLARTDLSETEITNEEGAYHTTQNTNTVVQKIDNLIASKTGYTPLAGGNLAIAFDAGFNRPVIAVVLGSTVQGRFDDIVTLVERTHTYLGARDE